MVREADDRIWEKLYADTIQFVEAQCEKRGLTYETNMTISTAPCHCHPRIRQIIEECAADNNIPHMHMVSYPAHDAMQMGRLFPMGMIFLRSSNGGVSHCPDELTVKEDLGQGALVLYDTLKRLSQMDTIDD